MMTAIHHCGDPMCVGHPVYERVEEEGGEGRRFVRGWVAWVARVDLLLFGISLILLVVTSEYVCFLGDTHSVWRSVSDVISREGGSTLARHLVVISLAGCCVAYFVAEVWLFCVLLKISEQYRVDLCIKWLAWRSIILGVALSLAVLDLAKSNQVDCVHIVVVPFQIGRMVVAGVPVLWVMYSSGCGVGGGLKGAS